MLAVQTPNLKGNDSTFLLHGQFFEKNSLGSPVSRINLTWPGIPCPWNSRAMAEVKYSCRMMILLVGRQMKSAELGPLFLSNRQGKIPSNLDQCEKEAQKPLGPPRGQIRVGVEFNSFMPFGNFVDEFKCSLRYYHVQNIFPPPTTAVCKRKFSCNPPPLRDHLAFFEIMRREDMCC